MFGAKRIVLVLGFFVYSLSADSPGTALGREQRQLLQAVIDRLSTSIEKQIITVPDPEQAQEALRTLRDNLSAYTCEFGCICDTLRGCIARKCVDLAPAVKQCLEECAQRSTTRMELTPAEHAVIQEKLSFLVHEVFMMQLVLLGRIDHAVHDTLQRYNLDTYGHLAAPFLFFGLYFLFAETAIDFIKQKFSIKHPDALKSIGVTLTQPQPETVAETNPVTEEVTTSQVIPKIAAGEFGLYALFQGIREIAGMKEAKLLPSLLFAPDMLAKGKKISLYATENIQQTYAKIANKKISSLYPVKKPRFTFEAKPKYAHVKTRLLPIIDFCSRLEEYRGIDAQLVRGYILQGDLKDGRDVAEAIAGELAQRCKEVNAPYSYGIHDMHASKFLAKEVRKVFEEISEYGPTVLVINDIDWIFDAKWKIKAVKYAEIINELTKLTVPNSTSNTVVILTTQDASKLERLMLEPYRFTVVDLEQTC